MRGSYMGGSGKRNIALGKKQEADALALAQTSQNKPRELTVEFASKRAREVFDELGLSQSDLGDPSGKEGKFTVADVRRVA